jgi:hypothetical protein
MVEIKCPACGAEGRAHKEKFLTRLVCKKCLIVFHVTPSGRTVLGEPPATGQTSIAGTHEAAAPDRTQEVDQWFDRVSKKFFSPKSLILTASLILLAGAAAFFSRGPETLQVRAAKAARAAVQGDPWALRELAATGTVADVDAWYVAIRPQCEELRQRLGSSRLDVNTEVKPQDSEQGWVEVIARVNTVENLERTGFGLPDPSIMTAVNSSLFLPMVWKTEGWGGWRLDGKRTQELSKTAP